MRSVRKSAGGAVASAVALLLVAACSNSSTTGTKAGADSTPGASGGASGGAGDAKVTLTVASGYRPGAEAAAVTAFKAQVADFESKNPNIKLNVKEYEWKGTTFAAQLAGGTVPTVFTIPFTDAKSLIEKKQISDMDAQVKSFPYGSHFNESLIANGEGSDGHIYAIPTAAYGIGLQYNRKLFTQAGLNPDNPPKTWDEVRAAAKQIAEKTHQAGYIQMTSGNTGGWQLTAMADTFGGAMTSTADGKTTATINNPGAKKALELLHAMRWDDKSMGSNFILDWPGSNQVFGAGKAGMYTQGADVYTTLIQNNKMDPAAYGLTTLPLTDDANAGVLTGGTLAAVKAGASDAEKTAAMKWIDFYYIAKLSNEDAAVTDAKTLIANKQPVGTPSLPIFDKEQWAQSQKWVAPYVNVPVNQIKPFTDNIGNQKLVNEAPVATQDIYARLDKVVQAVLTNKNANIDQLLNDANKDAQKLIDKASS